jgi:multidrug efflux pump subunit AcrB
VNTDLVKKHKNFINTIWVVFLFGCIALLTLLPREEIPAPTLEGVVVKAYLPGASAYRMDLDVSQRVSETLSSMTEIRSIVSTSSYEISSTIIELKRSENAAELVSYINSKLAAIPNLPSELEGPYIGPLSANMWPDVTMLLTGGTDSDRAIAWMAFRRDLTRLPDVGSLVEYGYSEPAIVISADAHRLQSFGLRLDELSRKVEELLPTLSPGKLAPYSSSVIKLDSIPADIESIRELTIPGLRARLDDVADISLGTKRPMTYALHDDAPSILSHIYKSDGGRVDRLSDVVQEAVTAFNGGSIAANHGVQLRIIKTKGNIVKEEVNALFISLAVGVAVVFVVIYLFLGLKVAFWSSMSIPFAFGAAIAFMYLNGISLNILSIFALILVIGMVVDDSVVVSEYLATSHVSRPGGAMQVTKPVIVSSLTTIAAFYPLMFISGDAGEILSVIPTLVIVTLLASLVECFVVLPVHLGPSGTLLQDKGMFSGALKSSGHILIRIVNRYSGRPKTASAIFFLLLLMTIFLIAPRLEYALTNITEYQAIRITMKLDASSSLDDTKRHLASAIRSVAPMVDGEVVLAVVGAKEESYHVSYNDNYAMFEVQLSDSLTEHAARHVAERIIEQVSIVSLSASPKYELLSNAPPQGADVAVEVYSADNKVLLDTVMRMDEFATNELHATAIDGSHKNVVTQSILSISDRISNVMNLSSREIANVLFIASNGKELGRTVINDTVIPIIVKGNFAAGSLEQITPYITSLDGRSIDSSALLSSSDMEVPAAITRRDGRRYMEFSANMSREPALRVAPDEAFAKLVDAFDTNEVQLKKGAQFEQIGDSLASGLILGIISIGACYAILVFLFQSYVTPLLVLICIPLSVAGGLVGVFFSSGKVAIADLIGIVGLFGISINIAILWLDTYLLIRGSGRSVGHSIQQTIILRTPAIVLTTLTTILALLPTIMTGAAGLAGSMAKVVASGLGFSAIGTILMLPPLVAAFDRFIQRSNHVANFTHGS